MKRVTLKLSRSEASDLLGLFVVMSRVAYSAFTAMMIDRLREQLALSDLVRKPAAKRGKK